MQASTDHCRLCGRFFTIYGLNSELLCRQCCHCLDCGEKITPSEDVVIVCPQCDKWWKLERKGNWTVPAMTLVKWQQKFTVKNVKRWRSWWWSIHQQQQEEQQEQQQKQQANYSDW